MNGIDPMTVSRAKDRSFLDLFLKQTPSLMHIISIFVGVLKHGAGVRL